MPARMLDLGFVTENLDDVRRRLATRGAGAAASLDRIAELSKRRSEAIANVEAMRAERNEATSAMAKLDKKSEEFAERRAALKALGERIKEAESVREAAESELDRLILELPNLPHESAPVGSSEQDNPVVRTWGEPPRFEFEPRDHVEIG